VDGSDEHRATGLGAQPLRLSTRRSRSKHQQGGRKLARERKHLFHVGLDQGALRKIKIVAVRDGVSQAEATRRIIESCDIDKLPPPPPPKRRRTRSTSGAESNAG
jgi:hypothetical protein